MTLRNSLLFGVLAVVVLVGGCGPPDDGVPLPAAEKEPPPEIPRGILVDELPENADIIFNSIRYVLSDMDCLDEDYALKKNFINDPDCNRKIYAPDGGLASPRQLFALDIESGQAAGIVTCGVTYGIGKRKDLERVQPDYLINNIIELPNIIA